MVVYTCPNCNKDFSKKYNFEIHLNKKTPCGQKYILIKSPPILLQEPPILLQEPPILLQKYENLSCEYCGKTFKRRDNLNRHLESRCKVKKDDDDNKKNIFELLLEKEMKEKELLNKEKELLNNKLNEQEKKVDTLQKQLLELTKTIKNLTNKTTTVINNNNNNNYGNINNIVIPSDKLAKFGKEDLTKITHKDFLKIKNQQGVAIFMETAKLIYNNHSVNKTVYVADYSRRKAMIWNGENWVLTSLEEVLDVMKERIRTLYNINLDLIEDERILKDFECRVQKYFEMLYDEYDEEKKDDKKFIARVNSLQEKYGNDLIYWLTNIKKDVVDNFNKISNQITNNKLLLIENDEDDEDDEDNNNNINIIDIQPIKKRVGRPKKLN